jgi:hypothetical protein
MKMMVGLSAVPEFNTSDLNNPVALFDFESGSFGIKYDLTHVW